MSAMIRSSWLHTKTAVHTRAGLVTARHPLASDAGARVLRAGGNAADAALAAMLVTGVVQPFATTIGGGGLLTAATPGGRRVAVDYRSQAPHAATPGMYGGDAATPGLFGWTVAGRGNEIGHRAVGVPGAIPGYVTAHRALGRLPWRDVLAPAIALAADGVETDWFGSLMQATYLEPLLRFDTTARTFLRQARYPHRPPTTAPGDWFRQPQLAATLGDIADGGLDAYVHGPATSAVVDQMAAHDGLITGADLTSYRPRQAAPHAVSYRGYRILGPTHGGLYGLLFAVLDQFDLPSLDPLAPGRLHLVAEALRRCRHLENIHAGDQLDPLWAEHPGLAVEIADTIDTQRRTDQWRGAWWARGRGSAGIRQEGTAHVSTIDADGMAVSLTETILGAYGSAVTTSAGVLLNNAMFGFVPTSGHPNSLAPGHRPHSNMTPIIALDPTGRPVLTAGASGGQRISAAVVQLVAYLLDHHLSAQDAAATPRLDVSGDVILLDSAIPADTAAGLSRHDHQVERVTEDLTTFHFANPSLITVDDDGVLHAGLNPKHLTAASGPV